MDKNEIEVDIKVPNQTRYLSLIGRIGEDLAKELDRYDGDRETLAYHINLVLTEAMVNAIKHANAGDPDKMVHVYINLSEHELVIRVYDDGQGFDISTIPPPDFDKLEDRGRGIFIIKSLMDSVRYDKINGGNVLEMCKTFRCPS
ncbi:anti-sigma factor [Geotalea uraniireducens]|uniref:Anti-sigma factor n=1 Tax=Geotalea uraniireducens TaxID=351604 RepID=A0ABN6VU02_9BACT|nr:ATP-binding protein [Geotalea uraniireducens]BDV43544.1 anti-sigma factor [Geotalea uraniireducens]